MNIGLLLSLTCSSPSGGSAPPRQNSSGPQRRIDQPPPPNSAPPGPPRGRTPPSMLSGSGGASAYPPRPASGSMMSSSPDWPSSGQTRLRQTSSSSKGDSPEKQRPAAKVTRRSPRQHYKYVILIKLSSKPESLIIVMLRKV